jgi:hypothetical protein
MNIFEFKSVPPQYTTGPGPSIKCLLATAEASSPETIIAATIEEALLVFKRNRPGYNILSIVYRGPALT